MGSSQQCLTKAKQMSALCPLPVQHGAIRQLRMLQITPQEEAQQSEWPSAKDELPAHLNRASPGDLCAFQHVICQVCSCFLCAPCPACCPAGMLLLRLRHNRPCTQLQPRHQQKSTPATLLVLAAQGWRLDTESCAGASGAPPPSPPHMTGAFPYPCPQIQLALHQESCSDALDSPPYPPPTRIQLPRSKLIRQGGRGASPVGRSSRCQEHQEY